MKTFGLAAVVVCLFTGCSREPSALAGPPTPIEMGRPATPPPPAAEKLADGDRVESILAALKGEPAARFDAAAAKGSWIASVTGARLQDARGALAVPPPPEDVRFTFAVTGQDGRLFLDGAELKPDGRALVAEAGEVTTRLAPVDSGLAGEIRRQTSEAGALVVIEFRAQRSR